MPDDAPHDEELEALLAYLRDQRGADFTGYKRPSLTRLINRRMRTAGASSYGEYVDLLQVEPSELEALLDVLLINVTAVFRDPAAWDELADSLLPVALAGLGPRRAGPRLERGVRLGRGGLQPGDPAARPAGRRAVQAPGQDLRHRHRRARARHRPRGPLPRWTTSPA